jgi:nucleotide-binding universal stress UspA family protein
MKILVPLDGSEGAEAALRIVCDLAHQSGATIVLLSVVNGHVSPDVGPADTELLPIQDAKSYLETAREHLLCDLANVVTTVWRGAPAAAIIRAAETYGADLIVMTTHGRTGRQREMFGSVADAVLRGAPMQVLVVRPRRDHAQTCRSDAITLSSRP